VIESAVLAPEPDDTLAQLPKRPELVPGYIRVERFEASLHNTVAARSEILVDSNVSLASNLPVFHMLA
jgi:hypothetical protein